MIICLKILQTRANKGTNQTKTLKQSMTMFTLPLELFNSNKGLLDVFYERLKEFAKYFL